MSNYVKATNFTAKDSLPSGNSGKIIKGAEIDTEFTAIASAVSSKADSNSPAFTGTPTAPTATLGTNTTQVANTAFVAAALIAASVVEIPSGTLMLFQQTSAPTGWTKQTTHDNKALRVVSGTVGSGGTTAFTSVFTNQTVSTSISVSVSGTTGATTLSTAQMPSHNHSINYQSYFGSSAPAGAGGDGTAGSYSSGSTGGNGSHTHSFSGSGSGSGTSSAVTLNVQYVDLIIASKS